LNNVSRALSVGALENNRGSNARKLVDEEL